MMDDTSPSACKWCDSKGDWHEGEPEPGSDVASAWDQGEGGAWVARSGASARAGGPDGYVDGTAGDDRIDLSYAGDPQGDRIDAGDAVLPGAGPDDDYVRAMGGNDTVVAGAGNDVVEGGAGRDRIDGGPGNDRLLGGPGNDTIDGGSGNDTIFGDDERDDPDPPQATRVRESFEWSKAPNPSGKPGPIPSQANIAGGFSQNTGNVDVKFFVKAQVGKPDSFFATTQEAVDGINGTGGAIPNKSSLAAEVTKFGQKATYELDFSTPVENMSFRINDIDNASRATIRAYDANGNPVAVSVQPGSGVRAQDLDGVAGLETLDSDGRTGADTDLKHSALVSIAGPVARIEIDHEANASLKVSPASGINVTNIYFDAVVPPDGYDDVILGGDGRDVIYGGQGNDTIDGGAGADLIFDGTGNDKVEGGTGNDTVHGGLGTDTLSGGDDRDTFIVDGPAEGAGDIVDGGEGGDDFDTLDLRATGPHKVNYAPDNRENGTVDFLNPDGSVASTLTFTNIENVVCFTPGTLIATPRGEVAVESLRPGDHVITRDDGIQEIAWAGARRMDWASLNANPHLRPILVRQGSLGHDLPERDMMVSPNHRMLVANERTSLYFDEHEVLVAAKHLAGTPGVSAVESAGTTYIHFMFDRHQVVLSNGAWTESFQPGDFSMKGMGNSQRSEIYELFPDLKTVAGLEGYAAARRTLKRHEARLLAR